MCRPWPAATRRSAMTTLIAAKAKQGSDNEEHVLSVVAAAGDAGMAPSEMAERTGLADRTWRSVVARLAGKNLLRRDGPKGRIYATPAGRSEAGAGLSGVALAGALGQAVELFPTEGHRALLRLLLSNVIARHHLGARLTENWGSFVVVGPTKAGKTVLALFVAQAFGLPRVTTIRLAPAMTPGEVWGRVENGPDGFQFVPSPVLGQPFVCLDEVDKAPRDTVASIMKIVQGQTEVAAEQGAVANVAPTALLCGNGRASAVRQEYRRRSVVLDLWEHEALLEDVPGAMRRLFTAGVIPRLELASYRPPDALPPELLDEMGRLLRTGLTPSGWRELDELALERMALGRAALVPDLRLAVLATVHDYLTCAATVGHTLSVPASLSEALGASSTPLAPNLEAAQREAREPQRRNAERLEDQLEFQRRQGALVEKLASWLRGLDGRRIPEAHKEEAAGLRKVIGKLKELASKQATLEGIKEITRVALPEVTKSQELLARVEQGRTDAERQKIREHDANVFAAEQKRRLAAAHKRHKEDAARQLTKVRSDIGVLEKLYKRSATKPGERADRALASLRLSDGSAVVLLEAGAGGNAPSSRFLQRYAPPPDVWSARFDPPVRFPATGAECPALARWGAETQQVLAPALRYVYGEEDRLVAAAGRRPRARTRLAV